MDHNFDKNQLFGVKKSNLCHLVSSLTAVRALKTIERYFYQLLWLTAKKLVYDWEQAENLEKILFLISQFLMICRSMEFYVSNCIVFKFMYSKFQLSYSIKWLSYEHSNMPHLLVNTLYIIIYAMLKGWYTDLNLHPLIF